ncbi:MAG: ABC transporter permease [Chitinophagaceae bacterium]|nr:ABC transporter permease [Chitinophagaceae bacterium]
MLSKLLATVRKETLLLLRDKVGLSILFIMPMVLIFVMTLIQDAAFSSMNEKGIPVVFVNEDQDSLGFDIKKGLMQNDLIELHDSINGKPATAENVRNAVSQGKFLVGIVVPKNATNAIRHNVAAMVDEVMASDSSELSTAKKPTDSVQIEILIDPIAKKSFLVSVTSTLREFISEIKTKIMFQEFSVQMNELIPDKTTAPSTAYEQSQFITYKETYASVSEDKLIPNAVQHNVPAWTIFAMFFISIPLSSSIIKEKGEGASLRLNTMPSPYLLLVNGKIIVYVVVCTIQFYLMMLVGLIFLPMLELPRLDMGSHYFSTLMLVLATSFAATGYGVMVGTLSKTEHQGAIMGSLSIILLSALGGIWVPSYVMPGAMRTISSYSPLNWSLSGFYELFLRGGGFSKIWPEILKLILFFFGTMSVTSVMNRKSRLT